MPRILVADDNTNIQRMVSLAFQERGIEVTSVGNGEAAVRRLPDLNPDLILADIFMPVRNGYEVCEWVKKDSKYSHIPVILLVGAFDPLDEKEARRVGADGVLKKPFIPPDPLIAMVTSTLEKNPKLAAEMAQAREAKAAPPPPPAPVVIPEVAQKIELKPLPKFEEPSADDASLAYGFGAGRRGLEDDGPEESAAARPPKSEFDKQAEEEFDGASTTNDWRRSAMAFEVPEEDSRRPAFSTDEEHDLAPTAKASTIADQAHAIPAPPAIEAVMEPLSVIETPVVEVEPSPEIESVVEAAAVSEAEAVSEAVPEVEAVPETASPEIESIVGAEPAVSAEQLQSWQSASESGEHAAETESEWASDEPDVAHAAQLDEQVEAQIEAQPEIQSADRSADHHPDHQPVHHNDQIEVHAAAPQPAGEKDSISSPVPQPETSFASKMSHWMDLMGSASGQPQSDWLSLINKQSAPGSADESASSAQPPAPQHKAEHEAQHKTDEPSILGSASAPAANHVVEHSEPAQKVSEAPQAANSDNAAATKATAEAASSEDEDWFFADEPEPTSGNGSQSASETVPSVSSAVVAGGSSNASQPDSAAHDAISAPQAEAHDSDEFEATVADSVPASSLHEEVEFAEEAFPEPVATTEPELIEPPAVHVTPEPLLVDEFSPKEPAAYGRAGQEIAPTYEFLPDVESKTRNISASSATSSSPETEDTSAGAEAHAAPSPSDESAPAFVRPPTREQLAHIPFLNPPPHFHEDSEPETAASNPALQTAAVDTVVQRILDKIEPQLHDLLAQNLKPLIENLVHTELQKKDH